MNRATRGLCTGLALGISIELSISTAAGDAGDAGEVRQPGNRDRCPVCGMFVAPFPEWIAQIVYEDDTVDFFDGCKDLFRLLKAPEEYSQPRNRRAVRTVLVTSYYDQLLITAQEAIFVAGSDVLGPMGAELIPLRSLEEAEEFTRDHQGTGIFRFGEVTPEVVSSLK